MPEALHLSISLAQREAGSVVSAGSGHLLLLPRGGELEKVPAYAARDEIAEGRVCPCHVYGLHHSLMGWSERSLPGYVYQVVADVCCPAVPQPLEGIRREAKPPAVGSLDKRRGKGPTEGLGFWGGDGGACEVVKGTLHGDEVAGDVSRAGLALHDL